MPFGICFCYLAEKCRKIAFIFVLLHDLNTTTYFDYIMTNPIISPSTLKKASSVLEKELEIIQSNAVRFSRMEYLRALRYKQDTGKVKKLPAQYGRMLTKYTIMKYTGLKFNTVTMIMDRLQDDSKPLNFSNRKQLKYTLLSLAQMTWDYSTTVLKESEIPEVEPAELEKVQLTNEQIKKAKNDLDVILTEIKGI